GRNPPYFRTLGSPVCRGPRPPKNVSCQGDILRSLGGVSSLGTVVQESGAVSVPTGRSQGRSLQGIRARGKSGRRKERLASFASGSSSRGTTCDGSLSRPRQSLGFALVRDAGLEQC